ncbi:MAG TPA: Ig-like domain-containing protein [Gemmatimonadaceae bacterium]|nr:Ig-like domain-containing protein [Gemmatimonadaceae bacterium]
MPAQLPHMLPSFRVLFAGILIGAAACGSDSPASTAPPPTTPGTSPTTGLSISMDSASASQTATVGGVVHVSVHMKNADGSAAASQTVTWTVLTGGGTVVATTSTTDAAGAAKIDWTIGTIAGANSLEATITGASVQALATGTADVFATLTKVSGDSQQVVSSASMALVVKAGDKYGNPAPGVTVSWTSSGGTLSPAATTTTGPTGNATITLVTGLTPATYTVTATAPGTAPILFTVKGI